MGMPNSGLLQVKQTAKQLYAIAVYGKRIGTTIIIVVTDVEEKANKNHVKLSGRSAAYETRQDMERLLDVPIFS
jgi:hypothetical protein